MPLFRHVLGCGRCQNPNEFHSTATWWFLHSNDSHLFYTLRESVIDYRKLWFFRTAPLWLQNDCSKWFWWLGCGLWLILTSHHQPRVDRHLRVEIDNTPDRFLHIDADLLGKYLTEEDYRSKNRRFNLMAHVLAPLGRRPFTWFHSSQTQKRPLAFAWGRF